MKRLVGKKEAVISVFFIVLLLITILSFKFDKEISLGIASIRTGLLNEFFLGFTYLSSNILIFFILTSLFLWSERKRKWIAPLWLTLFFSVAVGFLLKIIVQRPRPFDLGIPVIEAVRSSTSGWWNYSFPSFQAMLVLSALPILKKEFPRLKYIWYIFAFLVAFSRVYFGVHFLSDVLAGALIGYIIGLLVLNLEEKYDFGIQINEMIYNKIMKLKEGKGKLKKKE